MAKRTAVVDRPPRLSRRTIAHLDREARTAARRQRTLALAADRSVARLFILSAALIAASAIFGELVLGSSNTGLLSWVAIGVTALTWGVAVVARSTALVERKTTPTPDPALEGARHRDLLERRLTELRATSQENELRLEEKRRWTAATMQLVALQTALIVAIELAAR